MVARKKKTKRKNTPKKEVKPVEVVVMPPVVEEEEITEVKDILLHKCRICGAMGWINDGTERGRVQDHHYITSNGILCNLCI